MLQFLFLSHKRVCRRKFKRTPIKKKVTGFPTVPFNILNDQNCARYPWFYF